MKIIQIHLHCCATIASRSYFLLSWSSCELWTFQNVYKNAVPATSLGSHRHPILCKSRWFYDFMCLVIIIGNIGVRVHTHRLAFERERRCRKKRNFMYECKSSLSSFLLSVGKPESFLIKRDNRKHPLKKKKRWRKFTERKFAREMRRKWQAWRDFYITHVQAIPLNVLNSGRRRIQDGKNHFHAFLVLLI